MYRAFYDFAVTDLSAVYFDILKDRLYTAGRSSPERRSGQTALYRLNLALARLLAPILSFTCEEVWRIRTPPAQRTAYMWISSPNRRITGILPEQRKRLENWDALMSIRDQVLKSLDSARDDKLIGSSLEAAVTLEADANRYALLTGYLSQLPALFIVSQE